MVNQPVDLDRMADAAGSGESTRTVLVALAANAAVAVAKTVAAVTTRAVFAEDAGAVIGLVIAFLGIGLHQLTGDAVWDAVGSILIGVLLAAIAVLLIDRNRRFLTGEPGSAELNDAVVTRIRQLPDVADVRFVRLVYVGPKRLFLVASVDLVGDQVESRVAHTLRRLERDLKADPHFADAVLTIAEPDEEDLDEEDGVGGNPGGVQ